MFTCAMVLVSPGLTHRLVSERRIAMMSLKKIIFTSLNRDLTVIVSVFGAVLFYLAVYARISSN